MQSTKIAYWVATGLFFLLEGVMPALTSNTEMAIEGIRHLGYPDYFRTLLTIFKVCGSLALLIPMVPARLKEWAYAGFTFNIISAVYSHVSVDGFQPMSFAPMVAAVILGVSYFAYHRLFRS